MRGGPKKIIKNREIGKKLISGATEVQPIIGGIAPAAPPITMFRGSCAFQPKCINENVK